jgi:hypothetical protein
MNEAKLRGRALVDLTIRAQAAHGAEHHAKQVQPELDLNQVVRRGKRPAKLKSPVLPFRDKDLHKVP